MTDTMADRRRAPRYALIVLADITELTTGAKLHARTSDMSRTGCYIDTLKPLAKGSSIHVCFAHRGETVESNAKVVYVNAGLGMGIQFEEAISEDQWAVLDRWLEHAAHLPV
ncbi:MAG TPA: PilZ domain-containing protein [Methylomirabilota bacterium]|nr:PilZ domain-containing protein [Methylomirabilota bacterium]